MKPEKFTTVQQYFSQLPEDKRIVLQALREIIRECVPLATEKISYQMPAFQYHGRYLYYAGWKNHYAIYPGADTIEAFHSKLSNYACSKGAIQFPYGKEMPKALIQQIARYVFL